jgi:tetratricopeptide (TPR) repeat protein
MACWAAVAGLGAAFAILAAESAAARAADQPDEPSVLGSYLAGRLARGQHDTTAAADFYRRALALDPDNDVLIEQSFLMEATEGNWSRAVDLGKKLLARQESNRVAHLLIGISSYKAADYAQADEHFRAAASGPIGELTSTLARAWVKLAAGDVAEALNLLDGSKQAEWAQFYIRYHRALIADLGNRRADAQQAFERVFKSDAKTPRTAMAYAQHAANGGDYKLAKSILKEHIERSGGEGHPMVRTLRDKLEASEAIPLLVETTDQGLSEVFYGLGEALTGEGGVSIGALYLQMALDIDPNSPFALAALANVYETTKRYKEAIETYDRIPKATPLQSSIEIRKAINLNMLERTDEAKALLENLASRDKDDLRALDALGTIMRGRKRYEEAMEYYSRAISTIGKPEKRHWTYWYARGTCYERLKKWPQAEADLQKALQLYPDQPLVLNYLGYSWVDQNRNLKQGMSLIEKAVALKPDDGYIVDSLGWAHFRTGNYKEAVRYLERAVELKPEDPVLNDHLGDALWRVGRTREARYQWEQALTLSPEPEDAEKIKRKVQKGLAERSVARAPKGKEAARPDLTKKRVENKSAPAWPFQ